MREDRIREILRDELRKEKDYQEYAKWLGIPKDRRHAFTREWLAGRVTTFPRTFREHLELIHHYGGKIPDDK